MALSPRDKRLLVVFGVLSFLAIGFLVFRMMGSSGDSADGSGPVSPGLNVALPPATPKPSEAPPPELLVFAGRDPFLALIAPVASDSDSTQAPPANPADVPASGQETAQVEEHVVTLLDVFAQDGVDMVEVNADGTVYTVAEGKEFGLFFKLVALNGSCASFLHGESPFTLCLAESN
jgi:hypothetical protein